MFPTILTLSVLAGFGAAQTVDSCPPSISRDTYLQVHEGLCYQFVVFRQRTFSDATTDCASRGGSLIIVNSQALTNWLVDQLIYVYGYGAKLWIGLSDKAVEGTFVWQDGTALDYTNWAPGKGPLGSSPAANEDCVTMEGSNNGKWDDDICEDGFLGIVHHRFPYICQYKPRGTAAPTTLSPTTATPTTARPITATPSTATSTCPPFICDKDCSEEGFLKDKDSGCNICECGSA